MEQSRGSQWNIWDLHVHTPDSIIQNYGGATEAIWEKFITDLENLNPNVKVIGINDYLFLDGYRRVLKYKEEGRLKNLDRIFPVVELRLDKFGVHGTRMSRINFHVVFSDEVPADIIESQFLNGLSNAYEFSESVQWNAALTRTSLEDLGRTVRAVSSGQIPSGLSDLVVGFNTLNFKREEIHALLERHYFTNKFLLAIGKSEWTDMRWDQHPGEKRDLATRVDFLFTASQTEEEFHRGRLKLEEENILNPLIHASDAHFFSDSTDPRRIGRCYTWLKAETTFSGLVQCLKEPKNRIWVGVTPPPKYELVHRNPTRYLESIMIRKTATARSQDSWFNSEILMNPDLVAIIGNKGNGKSALADIIGLLGDTKNSSHFSFLNKNKFRKGNLARDYEATGRWISHSNVTRNLSEDPGANAVERIKYIPQQYLEKLCNDPDSQFESELKAVIFSHVTESDRLQTGSLDELIEFKTRTIEADIERLRLDLSKLNEEIINLEDQATENYRLSIQANYDNKLAEYVAQKNAKPAEVILPNDSQTLEASQMILDLNTQRETLKNEIKGKETRQTALTLNLARLSLIEERIQLFEQQFKDFVLDLDSECRLVGLNANELISVTVTMDKMTTMKGDWETEKNQIDRDVDPSVEGTLAYRLNQLNDQIKQSQDQLDEPQRLYHQYKQDLSDWKQRLFEIIGSENQPNTLRHIRRGLRYLSHRVQDDLQSKYEARRQLVQRIHDNLTRCRDVYRELYAPVESFIHQEEARNADLRLNFQATLSQKGFVDGFLSMINQGTRGSFQGNEEGSKVIHALIETTDFANDESVRTFVATIMEKLRILEKTGESLDVKKQLLKAASIQKLYDFVFGLSYVQPVYHLQLGEKNLSQLSPGERGALLLIFYLLVDKNDIPLVIDQPEENLDNQTVYQLLVPYIIKAKARRQIIIVTHNPNLAVVCDAEQIIYAKMDKRENRITYEYGAIENPTMNRRIIDVLEGTMPAFQNREQKYFAG